MSFNIVNLPHYLRYVSSSSMTALDGLILELDIAPQT